MQSTVRRGRPPGSNVAARITISLDDETLHHLRTWKRKHGIENSSEAVRRIILTHPGVKEKAIEDREIPAPETPEGDTAADWNAVKKGERFPLPFDFIAGVSDIERCPICGSARVEDDGMTWMCGNCKWAGRIEETELIVTRRER